ncbi:hypothetical protein BC835DRAFT_1421538 [Cytidiella melzeri]|nr:hypothetical protein BC835DRAFT_1421538 [Cytidiella melzeri]
MRLPPGMRSSQFITYHALTNMKMHRPLPSATILWPEISKKSELVHHLGRQVQFVGTWRTLEKETLLLIVDTADEEELRVVLREIIWPQVKLKGDIVNIIGVVTTLNELQADILLTPTLRP